VNTGYAMYRFRAVDGPRGLGVAAQYHSIEGRRGTPAQGRAWTRRG